MCQLSKILLNTLLLKNMAEQKVMTKWNILSCLKGKIKSKKKFKIIFKVLKRIKNFYEAQT